MNQLPFTPDIHQAVVDLSDGGRDFAVAVVLKDSGSTPRKAGTKAVIEASGAILGTVGGGAVEAQTQRLAVEAIRARRAVVFDFLMEGTRAAEAEPICGGSMRILIDPSAARHRAVYAQAVDARRQRRQGLLLTEVRLAREPQVAMRWITPESTASCTDFPGEDAFREVLTAGAPGLFVSEASSGSEPMEVLVEPLLPLPLIVIAGGGHVGQALAVQARLVDFDVLVIDDRIEFADPSQFPPGTSTRCGDIAAELASLPGGADTYIVLVTRGHQQDQAALAACIRKPAAYVGMIGSKRKVAMVRKGLLEFGAAHGEELNRLYAPIGLDIGAQTVPEIAASIVAELIAVRRKGVAGPQSLSAANRAAGRPSESGGSK